MLKNYFKPTPPRLLRISLGLKTLIGTVSSAAFFEGNKDAAFWFLVAGAIIDFLINCIGDNKNATMFIVSIASLFLFSSCAFIEEHSHQFLGVAVFAIIMYVAFKQEKPKTRNT